MEGVFDPRAFFNKDAAPAPVAPAPVAAPVAPAPTAAPAFAAPAPTAAPAFTAPAPTAAPAFVAPVAAPVAPAFVQPPQAAPAFAPQAPAAVVAEQDEDGDMGAISIGAKISKYPIARFRGTKGFNRRVGILCTNKWYAVKVHYEQGIGSYYCFGGKCCESSDPAVRYLVPVVVYDTDREGNIISAKFSVEYLSMADSIYDSLLLMHKNYPLDTIDMIISCTDEKYQKLTFTAAGGASWRGNQAFGQAIWEKYQMLDKHITRSHAKKLGKDLNEAEANYLRMKTGHDEHGGGAAPQQSSFDLGKFMNNR